MHINKMCINHHFQHLLTGTLEVFSDGDGVSGGPGVNSDIGLLSVCLVASMLCMGKY